MNAFKTIPVDEFLQKFPVLDGLNLEILRLFLVFEAAV